MVTLFAGIGCASLAPDTAANVAALEAFDAAPARLPAPETGGEAQAYLSGSLSAMHAGKPAHAAMFLDAILRSDHLTDRGRANVYWLASEAHRLAKHDDALLDALGGFLVASAVLPSDDELRVREVEARATLLARKVKDRALFGKSPGAAIPVEDARDPSGIVAELGCVEDKVATMPASQLDERRLEQRRMICSESGDSLVLWFDVTHTR